MAAEETIEAQLRKQMQSMVDVAVERAAAAMRRGEHNDVMSSIDTGLASIAEALDGNGAASARIIAEALKSIRFPEPKAPQITMPPAPPLPAPQVKVEPKFVIPAAPQPVVHVMQQCGTATFKVDFEYQGARLVGMTVTRSFTQQ